MIVRLNYLLITVFLAINILNLSAQELHTRSNKALQAYLKGKEAYDFVNYPEAEKYLVSASSKDENFIEAFLLLGELYKDLKEYDKSIKAYERVIDIDSLFFVPALFSLAEVCFFSGKYENAQYYFNSFLMNGARSVSLIKRTGKYLDDCGFAINAIKNPVAFEAISLGDSINTEFDEYWPAITADDRLLLFTRQIVMSNKSINGVRYQEDFYSSIMIDSSWSGARDIGPPLNTIYNEGAQTLAAGGQYMYFTACDRPDGRGGCDIYYSSRKTRGWSRGMNIGAPVNSKYWESQPSVTADGNRLYFVSNRPGGYGGMDLWVSNLLEEGGWSEPENLGETINTPGNEMSPFIHFDGKTLYFSSNGRPSMGGFDIFMSQLNNDSIWSDVKNLGYPINRQTDEIGMIINASGNTAYYSSTINPRRGRDLFSFEMPENIRPDPVSYIKGTVYDKISGKKLRATYELMNLTSNKIIMRSATDENGNFLICLTAGKNYGLNVAKDNYLFYSENFMLEGMHSIDQPFNKRVALSRIRVGETMSLHNIFFETDSWELMEESNIELSRLINLLFENADIIIEIGGHTDSSGSVDHNLKLSEMRAMTVADYLINNGIQEVRIRFKGYGETAPVSDNSSEEGRRRNRRTEIRIVDMR